MAKKHDDYAAAYQALLAADEAVDQAVKAHGPGQQVDEVRQDRRTAEDALRIAEEPLAAEIAAAWEQNRLAVAEAKQTLIDAARNQAQVEVACGNAARDRFVQSGRQGMPVLTDDEITQVNAARAATDAARLAHEEAKNRFKAGVTVDQLVEA